MATDSVAVLKHGVELGQRTWEALLRRLGWRADQVDKVICHQVGAAHQETILRTLGIAAEKEFSTFSYLGNIGTVSLPLTAALAEQREFLRPATASASSASAAA
jgi:3-oxoacyl-[acyl-carrier-protein] synthase-3